MLQETYSLYFERSKLKIKREKLNRLSLKLYVCQAVKWKRRKLTFLYSFVCVYPWNTVHVLIEGRHRYFLDWKQIFKRTFSLFISLRMCVHVHFQSNLWKRIVDVATEPTKTVRQQATKDFEEKLQRSSRDSQIKLKTNRYVLQDERLYLYVYTWSFVLVYYNELRRYLAFRVKRSFIAANLLRSRGFGNAPISIAELSHIQLKQNSSCGLAFSALFAKSARFFPPLPRNARVQSRSIAQIFLIIILSPLSRISRYSYVARETVASILRIYRLRPDQRISGAHSRTSFDNKPIPIPNEQTFSKPPTISRPVPNSLAARVPHFEIKSRSTISPGGEPRREIVPVHLQISDKITNSPSAIKLSNTIKGVSPLGSRSV